MELKANIVLVGFMGSGKTTVGRLLAAKLAMRFVDMDTVIEERQKKPVSRIFSEDGEPFFRGIERELVRELAAQTGLVIATGGGVVLDPSNIAAFSVSGTVVCLRVSPSTVLERVGNDTTRPLLAGGDKLKKVTDILESRSKLYDAIPNQVVTDNSMPPEAVAQKVISVCGRG